MELVNYFETETKTSELKSIRPRKKRIQHRKRIKDMRNIQLGITIGAVLERTLNKFFTPNVDKWRTGVR